MTSLQPDAPETLVEHTAFVRAVARAALRGDDLVDDVVQDTMLTALETSHHRRGPLRSWLAGVARNKANSLIRRRIARRRREQRASRDEATDGAHDLATRAEEGRQLVAAVLALEELYREPILLRYYEGLPPREIAQRLDIPVETARTRVKRGVERLRVELERLRGRERGDARVALLALAQLPSRGAPPAPALLAGGALMGKNWVWVAVACFVLFGFGLWLRPWDGDSETLQQQPSLATLAADEAQPELAGGAVTELAGDGDLPPPVDMDAVDRDRDLHGWVVRADGTPVAAASVAVFTYPWRSLGTVTTYDRYLAATAGPSTTTAKDGSFRLALERGDLVHVRVRAAGLATTEWTHLQAGERARLVLTAPARLIVTAVDASGHAVDGMPIRFFVNPERAGRWIERTVTTDAAGRAVFDDLPGDLEGHLDPQPQRASVGHPGWVRVTLPPHGDVEKRIELPKGRTLRGRVVDARSGEPLEGARVSMNWAFLPAVRTGADGVYELPGWTGQGRGYLHVVAPGFVQFAFKVGDGALPDIPLSRGATWHGRVVDAQGEPVAGALVAARRLDRGGGAAPSLGSATSRADGTFSLDGLDSPAHLLVIRRAGFGRIARVVEGHGRDSDLGDLVLPPPCEVRGTVTDAAGVPLPRTAVRLTPTERHGGDLRRLVRTTDDLGRFSFPNLEVGSFELSVGPRQDPLLGESVSLTTEEPLADLRLSLSAMRTVVVRVVDMKGEPVVGLGVWAYSREPPHRTQGTTDASGEATFSLAPRPYRVGVNALIGLAYDVPKPMELGASTDTATLTVKRLRPIRGRLLKPDGEPIAWGMLKITRDGDRPRFAHSDDAGHFEVQVSPDARVSIAFHGTVQNTMKRIHTFVPLMAEADDVAAGSSDVVMRAAAMAKDRALTIRLLDPAGKPVEGVVLLLSVPRNELRAATTGPDGRAEWNGLLGMPLPAMFAPGRHASIERPWIEPVLGSVTPTGQEVVVQYRVGVPIEGTLEHEDGTPAAHASVAVLYEGKTVGRAHADEQGRFVAVLDPALRGTIQLQARAVRNRGTQPVEAVLPVTPGQSAVVLRLKPTK